MANYTEIESSFKELLPNLREVFSGDEVSEVREFIDVGEYGLALDTLVDIFVEERKRAPAPVVAKVAELAGMMKLAPATYTTRLSAASQEKPRFTPGL